jgi:hypothetical protein
MVQLAMNFHNLVPPCIELGNALLQKLCITQNFSEQHSYFYVPKNHVAESIGLTFHQNLNYISEKIMHQFKVYHRTVSSQYSARCGVHTLLLHHIQLQLPEYTVYIDIL